MTRYLILILLFFLASVPAYSQVQYKPPYGFILEYNTSGGTDLTGTVDVDLDADEVGLSITANATQTSDLVQMFASDGTTHRFSIEGDGQVLFAEGTEALPSISFASFPSVGFRHRAGFGIDMVANNQTLFVLDANTFVLKNTIDLGWSSGEPDTQVIDTGIERLSAGVVKVTDGSTGDGDLTYRKSYSQVQSVSCTCSDDPTCGADATAGTLTLEPTSNSVRITNADPNGCDVTMSETNAIDGHMVRISVVSNAGGSVDFADTSGVTELTGAVNLDVWDTIDLEYVSDRWVMRGTSNN